MPARSLALVLPLLLLSGAAAGAGHAEGEPARTTDQLSVEGMTFVAGTGSHNDVIVEAARASLLRDQQVAEMETVHARVGKATGTSVQTQGGLDLRCDRASYDLESGDLSAAGNVAGVTADGRRFETQRLDYKRASGRVSTRAPVVIRDGFATIRGAGFEYWVRENRFRLIGGASVEQGS